MQYLLEKEEFDNLIDKKKYFEYDLLRYRRIINKNAASLIKLEFKF